MAYAGIKNKANWALYSFTVNFQKQLKTKSTDTGSKNAKKWAFFFKYYSSEMYKSVNELTMENNGLWLLFVGAYGWGSWIFKKVFVPWFESHYTSDSELFDAFNLLLIEFDTQNGGPNTQPNASQVAIAANNSAVPKVRKVRVRRGGKYKNSVTPSKLRNTTRAALVINKTGKYFYVSMGLLFGFEAGIGEFISALDIGQFLTNVNINKACRLLYGDWSKTNYSIDKKWLKYYDCGKKGSGLRVFEKEQFKAVYDNIKQIIAEKDSETFTRICDLGFDIVIDENNENNRLDFGVNNNEVNNYGNIVNNNGMIGLGQGYGVVHGQNSNNSVQNARYNPLI